MSSGFRGKTTREGGINRFRLFLGGCYVQRAKALWGNAREEGFGEETSKKYASSPNCAATRFQDLCYNAAS